MTRQSRAVQRHVKELLRDARRMAMGLIVDDVTAPPAIAARTLVFLEEAARISRHDYTPAEIAEVHAGFNRAWDYLTSVTHLEVAS